MKTQHSGSRRYLGTAALLALSAGLGSLQAQLTISTAHSWNTIDFDSSVAGVNNGAYTGTGFQATPSAGQLDSSAWAVTGMSAGDLAFEGTRTSSGYARGSVNVGSVSDVGPANGMFAFTGLPTGTALGIQPGGGTFVEFAPGTLTLKVQNSTGHILTDVQLAYQLYARNNTANASTFNFSYSLDNSSYNAVGALNYTSATTADANGFVANAKSTTLTGVNVANGGFIYLRWSSADSGTPVGARDEFALDNIQVLGVPEPSTWATVSSLGLAGLALVRRRMVRSA